MRFKIFYSIIATLFLIIFLGLVYTQIIRGSYFYELGEKNHIRLIEWDAARGRIFDRNGVVLADSKLSFDVSIIPQEFKEKNLKFLSKSLNIDIDALRKRIKSGYLSPFSPIVIAKNIEKTQALLIEQAKLELPGVTIQIKPTRFYPSHSAGAHVLGYVGLIDRSKITKLKSYGYRIQDIVGYSGVEEYYDTSLRGETGGIQVEVDNRGRQLRILGVRPTVKGKDLVLTIDSRIQKIASELLEERRGTIVVMQPYTGEILGLVSSPSFDPNLFTNENSGSEIKKILNDYYSPMLNRAISGLCPPGSVFKVVTALAALESKKITSNTSFLCPGSLRVGNRNFACWDSHGLQNLIGAIIHSCNVYFYNLGLLIGPEALTKYAKEFGFGSKTQIDLPYEEKGNVPDRLQRKLTSKENWYSGDSANFAIGQGALLATPLQAARLMAAVANGGTLPRPYVAEYIVEQKIHRVKISVRSPFNQTNLDLIKFALRQVVESPSGTAHLAEVGNLRIAGKTGTAQTPTGKSHAWFAGFCPADKPQVAFCVFLEYGGGSQNAVLIASRLLQIIFSEGILN